MLTIDRLSLRLPPGFEDRAAGLVDLIGDQLASRQWPRAASLDHVRVEHTLGGPGASNEAIAADIVVAVARHVEAGA